MEENAIVYFSDLIDGDDLKNAMKQKGINITERNVSNDIIARNEIILKGLRKLPIVKMNGKYLEGVDENSFI